MIFFNTNKYYGLVTLIDHRNTKKKKLTLKFKQSFKMISHLYYYNLQFVKKDRVHVIRQILFFLHSEEFLHDEIGSCYTSNHILYL